MALIYSDTAMLVDLLFIQAKQTKEGRKIVLLTLPSLFKASTPSGVHGDTCSQTFSFYTSTITFVPLAVENNIKKM